MAKVVTESEKAEEVSQVLKIALADFFTQLPATPMALGEAELAHIIDDRTHQLDTKAHLLQIQKQLEELDSRQRDMLERYEFLDPTVLQEESKLAAHGNPFRIVKAEDFDHDYSRLAALFREPWNYDDICGPDNLIIAGGRGCGKSMILRSLSAPAAVEIRRLERATKPGSTAPTRMTFTDSDLRYFGVYVKLARGYFYEWAPDCKLTIEAATVLFQHVFNMQLLRSLLDAIQDARRQNLIQVDAAAEVAIVRSISALLSAEKTGDRFQYLAEVIRGEEASVAKYLGDLRLGSSGASYRGHYTGVHDFPDNCCRVVLDAISDLRGCRVYFLLDEYENLAQFQQTVVNTIAKLRPFSLTLKVATRALGVRSLVDLQAEPIQTPRDYRMLDLDYNVKDAKYRRLLLEISRKRLEAEGFRVTDIGQLLERAPAYHPVAAGDMEKALEQHAISTGRSRGDMSDAQWSEFQHKWGEAFIFRLSTAREPRTYAGFDEFVSLSSGIVSTFLEMCKMAFYLAEGQNVDVRAGSPIPWDTQNRAVYAASKAYLDSIPRNIEKTGPVIQRLVLDIGEILRERLLSHTGEPVAGVLVLKDLSALEKVAFAQLAAVLDDGVRWSVFHTSGQAKAYVPRHRGTPPSSDYFLNRVLSPVLRISQRRRWRTEFVADELRSLIAPKTREATRKALIEKHRGGAVDDTWQFGNADLED